jgi:AbrB family looped-hinge helix DNA binding protein
MTESGNMEIQDIIKVSVNGQITIPTRWREQLHVKDGGHVSCKMTAEGLLIYPIEVSHKMPISEDKLAELEKISKQKGTVYKNPLEFKKTFKGK